MLINGENLRTLGISFSASFQNGLGMAPTDHLRVASQVPSSTRSQDYGWLGRIPQVRKWVGDRVIQNLNAHSYSLTNEDYELTIGVGRNDIEDDNLGIYAPMFTEMGRSVQSLPCELVYQLLQTGWTTNCYDGQPFFDADHPVINADGTMGSVSNTDGGAGNPWFLIDDSRAVKPLILQLRKAFEFVAKDRPTDQNVFEKKEFQYGADGRLQVGFGFWQFAWGSQQVLDSAHYQTARAAISSFKGDYGVPLGLSGKLLICGPSNEYNAREILKADRNAAGAANVWFNSAELLVTPWLP